MAQVESAGVARCDWVIVGINLHDGNLITNVLQITPRHVVCSKMERFLRVREISGVVPGRASCRSLAKFAGFAGQCLSQPGRCLSDLGNAYHNACHKPATLLNFDYRRIYLTI